VDGEIQRTNVVPTTRKARRRQGKGINDQDGVDKALLLNEGVDETNAPPNEHFFGCLGAKIMHMLLLVQS
jgi:hypothetical protein